MEWHPFSVSSINKDGSFCFHIKDMSNKDKPETFTSKLNALAKASSKLTKMSVDGPHGALDFNPVGYDTVYL